MFPTTFIDKTQCLQSLVGIRSQCEVEDQYPFWIEDVQGLDVKKLSSMTKASNPSGKDFGNQLINTAARMMLSDIEFLMNNGYKMNGSIGDVCSSCVLSPVYTANAGIIVKPSIASRYKTLKISKLVILADVTGTYELYFDDGDTVQNFDVAIQAGVLMPLKMTYTTSQKSVKIGFTDISVGLGQISCQTGASCGCGGSATANNPVSLSGHIAGVEGSTQYGFIPCVSIGCSYDAVVCDMIHQAENTFGLAMVYKIGELYYENKNQADRNNDTVSFNDEPQIETKSTYGKRYKESLTGTGDMMGLRSIVNTYLKNNRSDKCIICESKIQTAYATG